jgi:hypothetical protein
MDLSAAAALQGGSTMLSAFPLAGPSHAAAGRAGGRLDRSMPVDFFMYQVRARHAFGAGCVFWGDEAPHTTHLFSLL